MEEIEIDSPSPQSILKVRSQSTPSKIIIESHEQSYTFDRRSYNHDYLQGIITKLEWDSIISEASRLMGMCWSKKKIHDQIKLPRFMIISAIVSVVLIFIYMITLYIAATSDNDSTGLLTVAIICISIGTIIAGFMATYNFKRNMKKFQSLDDIIKVDIDVYLSNLNSKYKNKLEFDYITNTRWIEVKILDRRNINLINMDEERKKFITRDNYNVFTDVDVQGEENGARMN
jgi:hypothetical protein